VVTLAKGLAGGFPIGALIATGAAATLFEPGNHGTTFGGNPVAAAAALAVIATIEKADLLGNARARGEQLAAGLATADGVTGVDASGLLVGIQLADDIAPAVAAAALEAGFIVNPATPSRVRLAPPLILDEVDAAAFVDAWPGILAQARGEGSAA
jgi:acetylornithine aminotransferase